MPPHVTCSPLRGSARDGLPQIAGEDAGSGGDVRRSTYFQTVSPEPNAAQGQGLGNPRIAITKAGARARRAAHSCRLCARSRSPCRSASCLSWHAALDRRAESTTLCPAIRETSSASNRRSHLRAMIRCQTPPSPWLRPPTIVELLRRRPRLPPEPPMVGVARRTIRHVNMCPRIGRRLRTGAKRLATILDCPYVPQKDIANGRAFIMALSLVIS
jgi:hypothetical protein